MSKFTFHVHAGLTDAYEHENQRFVDMQRFIKEQLSRIFSE
jgi:hypothetical protein